MDFARADFERLWLHADQIWVCELLIRNHTSPGRHQTYLSVDEPTHASTDQLKACEGQQKGPAEGADTWGTRELLRRVTKSGFSNIFKPHASHVYTLTPIPFSRTRHGVYMAHHPNEYLSLYPVRAPILVKQPSITLLWSI